MSFLLVGCSFLFSLGLRLRGRHALFPPRGEEKSEKVQPERHAQRSVPQTAQPIAASFFL